MNLKDQLSSRVGSYCAVQDGDGVIIMTFVRAMWCRSEKDVKSYCEMNRCGRPGKVSAVGDDFISVQYFSGYSKTSAIIPFKGLLIEEGS
jgi:hypothetical protein